MKEEKSKRLDDHPAEGKTPLITIIIPVYNSIDCLTRCVDSCLNQTYRNLEILLVDDGSTDGTDKLCDKLADKDERIKVIHKENGGSSSARNTGIDQAKGEYLSFVDSDDYISKEMISLLIEAAEAHQVNIVQISRDEIDEEGNLMANVCEPPKEAYLCTHEKMMEELLMHRGDCSFCTKLIHRSLFGEYRFPEGKLNEDFFLLLQLLVQKENIYILPDQCYHVVYRMGSNTRKKDKNDFSRVFMDIVDNAETAMNIVDKHYPKLKKVCIRFGLVQRLDYLLHIPVSMMTKDNSFYRNVVGAVRKEIREVVTNHYLTKKQKIYLLLLAAAPKSVRVLHAKMKGI